MASTSEVTQADPGVLYEADQKVGIVTLNRPAKLNALTMELRLELERVLHVADDDPATSVIVWDPLESTCRHASLSIL